MNFNLFQILIKVNHLFGNVIEIKLYLKENFEFKHNA